MRVVPALLVASLLAACSEYSLGAKVDAPEADGGTDLPVDTASVTSPLLQYMPSVIDFGYVDEGKTATAEVTVRNDGDAPAELTNLSTGGSTLFVWSSDLDPITLAPGASGTITVTYRPDNTDASGTLSFVSNDPATPRGAVTLLGTGRNPALVATPNPLDFGSVQRGEQPSLPLTLSNPGNTTVHVTGLAPSLPELELVDLRLPIDVPAYGSVDVSVRLNAVNVGPLLGAITLASDSREPAEGVVVRAQIEDQAPVAVCSADPVEVAEVGGTATFYGSGSYDPRGGALRYSWTWVGAPAGSALSVNGSPTIPDRGPLTPDRPGTYTAQLVVTNDRGVPSSPCVASFEYLEIAQLSATPDPLRFGAVAVGGSTTRPVELRNVGNVDVDVLRITPLDNAWSVPARAPVTLPPGGRATVDVSWTPTALGADVSTLEVGSTAPLLSIGLEGEGTGSAPVAVCEATPDALTALGQTTTLVGSGSYDPGGRPLSYAWTLTQAPPGSALVLNGVGPDRGPLTPDVVGDYRARLVVTNDLGLSSPPCTASFDLVTGPPRPADDCVGVADAIYVLGRGGNELYTFDPVTQDLTWQLDVDCDWVGAPESMAVSRRGTSFVRWSDQTVYEVDLDTGRCTDTPYRDNGFGDFGMGFATDTANTWEDQLYIANDSELAVLDTSTWRRTILGPMPSVSELTGNAAGELWAFLPLQKRLQQRSKVNGALIEDMYLGGFPAAANIDAFAFATYGGEFWLFVREYGVGNSSDLYRVSRAGRMTLEQRRMGIDIIGAGVSTCVGGP